MWNDFQCERISNNTHDTNVSNRMTESKWLSTENVIYNYTLFVVHCMASMTMNI